MTLSLALVMHPRPQVVRATGFIDDAPQVTESAPVGSGVVRDADRKLLVDWLRAGRTETGLASIAWTRGSTDLVRQLAGHVRFDYAIANRELMAFLEAHHIAPPPVDSP